MKYTFLQTIFRFVAKFFVVLFVAITFYIIHVFVLPTHLDHSALNTNVPPIDDKYGEPEVFRNIEVWKPPATDLDKIMSRGCVADGLLSGYNRPDIDIPLARESNCHYFHRALETWLAPPDFAKASSIIAEIGRDDVQYGMFIAEAISTKADYTYREEGRKFDFSEMCRSKSKNFWGEHTCKPSFREQEYRDYIRQITRDAMDIGVRVFLFGQIKHQEKNFRFPLVDNIIRDMRSYAKMQGIEILIGGQTGDITSKRYLGFFDYIDGGVGLLTNGGIEQGPCFSVYQESDPEWCWPLMWHEDYKGRAKNVFTYMDWNGQIDDEMHVFTSMDTQLRHKTLRFLHSELPRRGVAFFPPLITPLPPNGGDNCHGPRDQFYTPHMKYECKDIGVINDILRPRE